MCFGLRLQDIYALAGKIICYTFIQSHYLLLMVIKMLLKCWLNMRHPKLTEVQISRLSHGFINLWRKQIDRNKLHWNSELYWIDFFLHCINSENLASWFQWSLHARTLTSSSENHSSFWSVRGLEASVQISTCMNRCFWWHYEIWALSTKKTQLNPPRRVPWMCVLPRFRKACSTGWRINLLLMLLNLLTMNT